MSKGLDSAELERLLYADSDDEMEECDITLSEDEESDREPEINDEVSDLIQWESEVRQETSVEQEENESVPEVGTETLSYKSKDGRQWSKIPFPQTRRSAKNIIKKKQGLTPYSSNFTTEIEALFLFLSDDIMEIIVVQTNRKTEEVSLFFRSPYLLCSYLYSSDTKARVLLL